MPAMPTTRTASRQVVLHTLQEELGKHIAKYQWPGRQRTWCIPSSELLDSLVPQGGNHHLHILVPAIELFGVLYHVEGLELLFAQPVLPRTRPRGAVVCGLVFVLGLVWVLVGVCFVCVFVLFTAPGLVVRVLQMAPAKLFVVC